MEVSDWPLDASIGAVDGLLSWQWLSRHELSHEAPLLSTVANGLVATLSEGAPAQHHTWHSIGSWTTIKAAAAVQCAFTASTAANQQPVPAAGSAFAQQQLSTHLIMATQQ